MQRSSLFSLLLVIPLTACDGVRSAQGTPSGGRNYIAQHGDTLYSIAQREYGDPLKYVLIQEHNPWLGDPERLRPGDIVFIPPGGDGENYFNVNPNHVELEGGGGSSSDESSAAPEKKSGYAFGLFKNFAPEISGRTLFGEPVDKLGFLLVAGSLAHAVVQGFLLWIIATITFVRDVSLKKSLKAAFHIELITLFTVVVLGGVAVLMIHIGTTAPGSQQSTDLLATMEAYLKHPLGMVIGGFAVFFLYVLLSLRYVPQEFGLERAQSTVLVFLAILVPHLLGIYTVGQRLGLIQL